MATSTPAAGELQLPEDRGLQEAAFSQGIDLASFDSGQMVVRFGMAVSGFHYRNCGRRLAGLRPIRSDQCEQAQL